MKSLNKITALNIVSTILLQGISFFTIPIFTKVLGAEQYGVYSVFNSYVSIMTCFMGVKVGAALATGRYEFKDSYYRFRSSILLLGTIISAVIAAIIIILIKPISAYLGYAPYVVVLLLLTAIAEFVISFAQSAFIYEKKAELNAVISVTLSLTTVGLSLVLIQLAEEESRFLGRIYGVVLPKVIIAIFVWILLYTRKPTGLHINYSKYALGLGVPSVFHLLSHSILSQSDRVMMQKLYVSNTEIGIYSLFYTFSAVLSTILNALNTSWCPFYYDDLDGKKWDELQIKCKNYIELFTVIIVGFLLLSREVSYFLAGSEYWSGIDIIPIFAVSIYFTFMYQFPVNFELFHRKTKIVAMGTASASVVNIILNAMMIPMWGMYGAALATLISYAALFAAHYMIVSFVMEERYHLKLGAFLAPLMVLVIAAVIFYVLKDFWYIRWIVGALLGLYEIRRIIKRKTIF